MVLALNCEFLPCSLIGIGPICRAEVSLREFLPPVCADHHESRDDARSREPRSSSAPTGKGSSGFPRVPPSGDGGSGTGFAERRFRWGIAMDGGSGRQPSHAPGHGGIVYWNRGSLSAVPALAEFGLQSLRERNCLITGPAGSGKLSLVYGLSTIAYPPARQFLFDWEVEESTQAVLQLELRERAATPARAGRELWILRRLDRVSVQILKEVLEICWLASVETSVRADQAAPIVFATARDAAPILDQIRATCLFPSHIRTIGLPANRTTLGQVAHTILHDLNRKHFRSIRSLDDSAIEYLLRRPWTDHYRELRSLMERAYLAEESDSLTSFSFANIEQRIERKNQRESHIGAC